MTIVNPLSVPTLIQQTNTGPVTTPEERQVDLRMEQIVRATVVEGGLERALLELDHRHYRAQSDLELRAGQKLTLQVLQTHPRLEFRVLNDQLGGRLSQLLPMLTRPYDWSQLLKVLQQQPQGQLPPSTQQVYQQLQQLLLPGGELPKGLSPEIIRLADLLRQMAPPTWGAAEAPAGPLPASAGNLPGQATGGAGTAPELIASNLIRDLHQQLAQLPKGQVPAQAQHQPLPQTWLAETRGLLQPLQQTALPTQLPAAQLAELVTLLGQLQQRPQLPAQFNAELGRLLAQLSLGQQPDSSRPAAGVFQSQAAPQAGPQVLPQVALLGGVAEHQQAGAYLHPSVAAPAPATSPAPVVPQELSADLAQLLTQVKQLQAEKGALPPTVTGQLEGLLEKLQQLPQKLPAATTLLPGLEALTSQLTQIVQQQTVRPEGGQLGILSQMFGFHLEAELLNGKKKDALTSLKLSLLSLREELGKTAEEPLRRLEILQMSKAKLAEEQVQFLPLPFPELEEGYLYVEKQREQDDEQQAEAPFQLSISLRVSALGNMRIDMLYEKQGLHLRLACENKEKMEYLRRHTAELEEAIETVPLQGVSFAADARVPTQQLLERLLPEALGMFDARI